MIKVDLNSDLGESFGAYTIGMDAGVLSCVSSANIACGFHAGDPCVMAETVRLAQKAGVAVGAHPGYPDLMGFGRRNMACSEKEIKAYTQYQLGALLAIAQANGTALQHVKPHGALYNAAGKDETIARAIAQAIAEVDPTLILLGISGSKLIDAGREAGLRVAHEVFADRAYRADGSLVPRTSAGAVIDDKDVVAARVVRMVCRREVVAITGEVIPVQADSICVHGDNPHAVELARMIRNALEAEGVTIAPLAEVI